VRATDRCIRGLSLPWRIRIEESPVGGNPVLMSAARAPISSNPFGIVSSQTLSSRGTPAKSWSRAQEGSTNVEFSRRSARSLPVGAPSGESAHIAA
jgi:hypothetical protein